MKLVVLFAVVALAAAQDYYDDIDVAAILANPVELRAYLDCFEDKGHCTDLAYSYKTCSRCNAKQKFVVWTFLQVMKLLPQEFLAFKSFYDPENKYLDALKREVSKYSNKPVLDILPVPHLL